MEGYQQLPISRNATHRKLYSFKIQCTERDRAWVDFLNSMALIRQARWHKRHPDFSHSETTVGGILKFKHESLPSYFSPPLQTIDPYPPHRKDRLLNHATSQLIQSHKTGHYQLSSHLKNIHWKVWHETGYR